MDPANTTRGNVTPKGNATESVPKVPAESPVVARTAAGSRKPAAPAGAEAESVTPFAHTSLDAYHLARNALVKGNRIAQQLPQGYGPLRAQLRRASQVCVHAPADPAESRFAG